MAEYEGRAQIKDAAEENLLLNKMDQLWVRMTHVEIQDVRNHLELPKHRTKGQGCRLCKDTGYRLEYGGPDNDLLTTNDPCHYC
jgi:hypothetical protein